MSEEQTWSQLLVCTRYRLQMRMRVSRKVGKYVSKKGNQLRHSRIELQVWTKTIATMAIIGALIVTRISGARNGTSYRV
jgi:hypothetical protein